MSELSDRPSMVRKIICWECQGSGVMAKAGDCVPCEVCQNEYGELRVVPEREVERLRAFVAEYDRECEEYGVPFNFALRDARRALDEGEETR